uniref:Uncharacterized protein n=1 Tax=viral metagenome TaxID=1070528 RepID=A0A6C0C1P2_9ZZZZ
MSKSEISEIVFSEENEFFPYAVKSSKMKNEKRELLPYYFFIYVIWVLFRRFFVRIYY